LSDVLPIVVVKFAGDFMHFRDSLCGVNLQELSRIDVEIMQVRPDPVCGHLRVGRT